MFCLELLLCPSHQVCVQSSLPFWQWSSGSLHCLVIFVTFRFCHVCYIIVYWMLDEEELDDDLFHTAVTPAYHRGQLLQDQTPHSSRRDMRGTMNHGTSLSLRFGWRHAPWLHSLSAQELRSTEQSSCFTFSSSALTWAAVRARCCQGVCVLQEGVMTTSRLSNMSTGGKVQRGPEHHLHFWSISCSRAHWIRLNSLTPDLQKNSRGSCTSNRADLQIRTLGNSEVLKMYFLTYLYVTYTCV